MSHWRGAIVLGLLNTALSRFFWVLWVTTLWFLLETAAAAMFGLACPVAQKDFRLQLYIIIHIDNTYRRPRCMHCMTHLNHGRSNLIICQCTQFVQRRNMKRHIRICKRPYVECPRHRIACCMVKNSPAKGRAGWEYVSALVTLHAPIPPHSSACLPIIKFPSLPFTLLLCLWSACSSEVGLCSSESCPT